MWEKMGRDKMERLWNLIVLGLIPSSLVNQSWGTVGASDVVNIITSTLGVRASLG